MRFRQETIAIMADVEAMFYQVGIKDEDTNLLRFLWWPEGNYEKELAEYKMLVPIFVDFVDEFGQEAAGTVKANFYINQL